MMSRRLQRRLASVLVVLLLAAVGWVSEQLKQSAPASEGDRLIAEAFAEQRGDLWVRGEGTVERVLPDDTRGSQHQRFLLRLNSGATVLVAHNIDLAPRVPGLREGDRLQFYGEYEYNPKGGVVHWTHHNPRGGRGGWLELNGQRYE